MMQKCRLKLSVKINFKNNNPFLPMTKKSLPNPSPTSTCENRNYFPFIFESSII